MPIVYLILKVEVLPGDDDDEEDEEDEDEGEMSSSVMAVEGSDGQQYVVLEVIQLPVRELIISIKSLKCFFIIKLPAIF